MTRIDINELPRYLPGVEALLRQSDCSFPKNETATHKEYETDKWGKLLLKIEKASALPTFVNVCDIFQNNTEEVVCFVGGELCLTQREDFYALYRKMVRNVLYEQASPGDLVVELGCGFGQISLGLLMEYPELPFTLAAGDFSENGLAVAQAIARQEGLSLETFVCNFYQPGITTAHIAPGAILFTSYAACCLPSINQSFFDSLLALRPKLVIHFEPCYELIAPSTLLGLLMRRYIEVNDYNRDMVGFLRRQATSGRINILRETPLVMGLNPLLPQSTIIWQPVNDL